MAAIYTILLFISQKEFLKTLKNPVLFPFHNDLLFLLKSFVEENTNDENHVGDVRESNTDDFDNQVDIHCCFLIGKINSIKGRCFKTFCM